MRFAGAIRNPQSEIRNPQPEIRNPQSEIRNDKGRAESGGRARDAAMPAPA